MKNALLLGLALFGAGCGQPPSSTPDPQPPVTAPAPTPSPTPTPTPPPVVPIIPPPNPKAPPPPLPPVVQPTCKGLPIGGTLTLACPEGQKGRLVQTCTAADTMVTTVNTCRTVTPACPVPTGPAATVTTFADVKPIIISKCVSCHLVPASFADFATAKAKAPEMLRRISLADSDPQRMPKTPNAPATAQDKATFSSWITGGLLEAPAPCPGAPPPPAPTPPPVNFIGLDDVETAVLADLQKLASQDRANTRYLITSHRSNEGQDIEIARQAVAKSLNGLNSQGINLVQPVAIDAAKTIWRVDITTLNISHAKWQLVVRGDPFQIESFTTKGALIKTLAGTNLPWMHFDNFIDVTYRNSDVYYALLDVPATFSLFTAQIGATFAQDAVTGDLNLLGFNGSKIAQNKNRMALRNRIKLNVNEGYLWTTYDVAEPVTLANQNLFRFPLIKESNGKGVFNFQASETINSLPNGLQQYGLWNSAGKRLNSADPAIVRDTDSPLSSIINSANSCSRCHNNGINPMTDQVLANVTANAGQFDPQDVLKVRLLYKPLDVNIAQTNADIKKFGAAISQLGIPAGSPDPMNVETDIFLGDWTIDRTAAFLLLPTATFKPLLQQSPVGLQEIGVLLTGGTVTRDQILRALPALKNDLRLFQDPLGR